MTKRFIMRIELTGPAKTKVEKLSDEKGMTQVAMMSRLVEWFGAQNEMIQGAVMGHLQSEVVANLPALIAKNLAK